jgi:hypothetical protein
MCHQSVGLIQSIIERAGIPTASVTLLKEITARHSRNQTVMAFPVLV